MNILHATFRGLRGYRMERIVSALRRGFADSFEELADTVVRCDVHRWSLVYDEPYLAPGRLASHAMELASSLISPGRCGPPGTEPGIDGLPSRAAVAERVTAVGKSVDRWFRRSNPSELVAEEPCAKPFATKLECACLTLRLLDEHLVRLRRHAREPAGLVPCRSAGLDAAGA